MGNNRYVCIFEIEGRRQGEETLHYMFFDDFIKGYEWVQEFKDVYKVISFAQEVITIER